MQTLLEEIELESCAQFVHKNELAEFTSELVWQKLFRHTRCHLVPSFWSHFQVAQDETEGFKKFILAVTSLKENIKMQWNYFLFLDLLSTSKEMSFERFKVHLSSVLLSQIPKDFESIVNAFYSQAFRAFMCLEKRGQFGNAFNFNFNY